MNFKITDNFSSSDNQKDLSIFTKDVANCEGMVHGFFTYKVR